MFKRRRREVSLYISQKWCLGCEYCIEACPQEALGMIYKETEAYATVEFPDRCNGCGRCSNICPANAIEIMKIGKNRSEALS